MKQDCVAPIVVGGPYVPSAKDYAISRSDLHILDAALEFGAGSLDNDVAIFQRLAPEVQLHLGQHDAGSHAHEDIDEEGLRNPSQQTCRSDVHERRYDVSR